MDKTVILLLMLITVLFGDKMKLEEILLRLEQDRGARVTLIERLAELEHQQWSQWAGKLIDQEPHLSIERVERWKKLFGPYSELSEEWKDYDRAWAQKVIDIIYEYLGADTILDVDPSVILKFVSAIREMEKTLKFYGDVEQWQEPDKDLMYWTLWDDGNNIGFHEAADCLKRVEEILK